MTKTQLLTTLRLMHDWYLFSMLAANVVAQNPAQLTGCTMELKDPVDGRSVTFPAGDYFGKLLKNEGATSALLGELEIALRKKVVSGTHEVLSQYCSTTHQTALHVDQPWYQFCRILRNSVSHGRGGEVMQWPRNLRDKGVLEVTWRHKTIRHDQGDAPITLSNVDCLELIDEQYAWASASLK